MELKYQKNWPIIKQRMEHMWNLEIMDRVCISVVAPLDKNDPYVEKVPTNAADLERYYFDAEWILKRNIEKFDKTYFGGDAMPCLFPYFGTGGHAKYICDPKTVELQPDTIWIHPCIKEEYDSAFFQMKEDNAFFQKELAILKELSKEGMGKFFVSMPDNCGSFDGLSQLRGNVDLMLDMLDDPEPVKEAGLALVSILKKTGDQFFDAIYENNDCGSVHGWMNTWCPGKHMQLQCDLSVMLSPDLYREFIMEELISTSEWLDRSIYHMDGIEQIRHLDMILSVPGINMIQWVPVAGQPPITDFFPEISRIQAAGRGLVLQLKKKELAPVLENLSPKGLMIEIMDAESKEEADEIVKYAEKHTFTKKLF